MYENLFLREPRSRPAPIRCLGFMITDTPRSVGLPWTGDEHIAETSL